MVHANLPETNKKGSSLLVSIVVPVYNCPHCIAATLRSILAQSFTDYEIILVNDGSSDTALLEQALSPFLSFLRYFKQENQGPGAARNRGVEEARGYYVAFLDADDLWLPCHLANQAQILQNNANLVLVYANWFVLHGNALIERAFDRKPQSVPVTLDRLLSETCMICTSTVVASRADVLGAGCFRVLSVTATVVDYIFPPDIC